MKKLSYCLLALLCPMLSMCQPITIQGKVITETGEAIPAATVTLKRTNQKTVTDVTGSFTFASSLLHDTLIISATGYETMEEPNNERGMLTIVLQPRISLLDQVVVMAYGTTTRRLSTGNITKVSAEDISRQPVSNPLAALEGLVPGLIVTQTSGVAGSGFNLQIRGRSSLDLSLTRNDPLFIIDGVPFESGNLPSNQLSSAATNPSPTSSSAPTGLSPFNSLNPQDIESIEVLKDADATAIYGSRGANGVLLITTKKARAGKTKFSLGMNSGFSRTTRTMDMLNTTQYLAMRHEAFANDGINATASNAPDLLLWDTTQYTDFKQLFTGHTATQSTLQASLSGGTANTQFMMGAGYHTETNVFPGYFPDTRGSFQFNLFHTPASKKWDTRLSVIYSSDKNRLFRTDLTKYIILPPHLQLYTPAGRLNWQQGGVNFSALGFVNPLAEMEKKYTSLNQNLSANLVTNYNLFRGLVVRTSLGYNTFTTDELSITPKTAIAPENSTLAFSQFANGYRSNWIIEPQLEYNCLLLKGKLQALAGSTFQERNYRSTSMQGSGYTNDLLLSSISAAGSVSASNNLELYHYNAFFGRLRYNLQDKYLLTLSGRRDGSSRFGTDRRFANFGAAGAAWIFSSEPWLSIPFLSYGKLRSSYGITGNDQIGDYKYLDLWSSTSNPYQGIPGLRPSGLFNPDFTWEKNKKFEAAIELGFFHDRLTVSTAYYQNRSSNQLISYRLPNQTGFATVTENLPALVQNKGWEIVLQSSVGTGKKFSWKSSFNITLPSNKLISFPGLKNSSYNSVYAEGKSLSVLTKLKYLGVDAATGLYKYEDVNGNGVISTPEDLQVLGDLDPGCYGGFLNTFRYKSFQVDVFFQFTQQTGSNYLASQYQFPAGFLYNQPTIVLDRWQKPGDINPVQRYTSNAPSSAFQTSYQLLASDAVYTDASFIRLKNLSLSYDVPGAILKKIRCESGRLYIQAQNLVTFTHYQGADPETQNFYQLPPLKTIVFGIQFTF